jgi:hypothetical protein
MQPGPGILLLLLLLLLLVRPAMGVMNEEGGGTLPCPALPWPVAVPRDIHPPLVSCIMDQPSAAMNLGRDSRLA